MRVRMMYGVQTASGNRIHDRGANRILRVRGASPLAATLPRSAMEDGHGRRGDADVAGEAGREGRSSNRDRARGGRPTT